MNAICIIDLEWTFSPGNPAEIIQIGAEMIDAETFINLGSFNEYVCPENAITRRITNLTGISNLMVADAEKLLPALLRFFNWAETWGEYKVVSWDRSDIRQIQEETKRKGIVSLPQIEKLEERYIDFQRDFSEALSLNRSFSLKDALELAGLSFNGKQHNGYDDAKNTAMLYVAFQKKNSLFRRIVDSLEESRRPMTTCLGSLLSSLQLAG